MNAHLTRLGLEAKDYAYTTIRNFKDKSYEFEQVYLARFAELILQDCFSIIESKEYELCTNPITEVKQAITQHFSIDAK